MCEFGCVCLSLSLFLSLFYRSTSFLLGFSAATPHFHHSLTQTFSLFSFVLSCYSNQIESLGGFLVKGDVFDPKSVKKALNLVEEYDAVVSTVGGTPADPKADSEGNIALIDACVAKGIKKFVLVTSIGTGDSKSAPPQNVYDALEPVLIEKEKAEEHLKKIAKENRKEVREFSLHIFICI